MQKTLVRKFCLRLEQAQIKSDEISPEKTRDLVCSAGTELVEYGAVGAGKTVRQLICTDYDLLAGMDQGNLLGMDYIGHPDDVWRDIEATWRVRRRRCIGFQM